MLENKTFYFYLTRDALLSFFFFFFFFFYESLFQTVHNTRVASIHPSALFLSSQRRIIEPRQNEENDFEWNSSVHGGGWRLFAGLTTTFRGSQCFTKIYIDRLYYSIPTRFYASISYRTIYSQRHCLVIARVICII